MSEINKNELTAEALNKVSGGEGKANGFSLVSVYCVDCGATMGSYSSTSDAKEAMRKLNGVCRYCHGRLMVRDEWIE